MYCIKCGAENLEAAKFCRKCGESFEPLSDEPEVETRVAVRSSSSGSAINIDNDPGDDGRTEIFSITPTLLFVKAGYAGAALGALLLVALLGITGLVGIWISILMGLFLFLVPAYFHIKQKLVRYTLTDTSLEFDSGLISRTTRNVPLRRIQDVTVSSNVFQRLLGFGDLVIDNASEEGGKAVLRNINDPRKYADVLLSQMRRLER